MNKKNLDINELVFFCGLVMLYVGLALESISMACTVVGAILTFISLVNSYVLIWLNRK